MRRIDREITTSAEEFDERWLEHFKAVFDAEILANTDELDVHEPEGGFAPAFPAPSIERTERALSRLAKGKALGNVEIPVELIAAGASAFAAKYHEILVRMRDKANYPRRWRGGRIVELIKRGRPLIAITTVDC